MIQAGYIGYKLGWYEALSKTPMEKGMTPEELAQKTQTSARYAREWLELQAIAGWIVCLNPSEGTTASQRRYVLPRGHAVLVDVDSLSYFAPMTAFHAGTGRAIDQLVHAYRTDTGVSWNDFGNEVREAEAAMNRPFYLQQLSICLEGVLSKDTLARLHKTGGKVADIGAGYAWSSIGIARHFPAATIDVYDLDKPSVNKARENVILEGLGGRIAVHWSDAAVAKQENFDLVLACECIHDMPDPIAVLRTMRHMAKPGSGTVIVMDELTQDNFSVNLTNPMEQFFYGVSCLCCLADGKSSKHSVETGTVMRPSLFRMYAQQAGFREVEILPIENDMFRFYKLLM